MRDSAARSCWSLRPRSAAVAERLGPRRRPRRLSVGGAIPGWETWDEAVAAQPDTPIADERAGIDMLYSSGTTGRPKGVRVALPEDPDIAGGQRARRCWRAGFTGSGRDSDLSQPRAALSRRAAALVDDGAAARRDGGDDAAFRSATRRSPRSSATASMPANGSRRISCGMLKLDPRSRARARYVEPEGRDPRRRAVPDPGQAGDDRVVGAGAVRILCRVGGQRPDHDQFGANGSTHKGSVGKAAYGVLHICGEDGDELPPGAEGLVYFEGGTPFEYHNDPAKTAEARNALWLDDARRYRAGRRGRLSCISPTARAS